MEFRVRSQRVPRDLFPAGEIRIYVGGEDNRKELAISRHRRDVLRKLERRGQWNVLYGLKSGRLTVEEVVRLVDERGFDTLHLEIRNPGLAPSIKDASAEWLATVERESTRSTYRLDIGRLVAYVGPETPVNEVGRHHVNDCLAQLREQGFSPNTRAGAKTAWSAFFTWFEDRDRSMAETTGRATVLKLHPVRGTKKVQTQTTRHRFLAWEEYQRLLEETVPQMRAQYATLAFGGLRIGEFMVLPPEHIKLPTHIAIQPFGEWAPKGHPLYTHGVRNVPIHRTYLLPLLEEYARDEAGEFTFFVNPRTGERWTHHAFREQLIRDSGLAGIPYGARKGGKPLADGITPHTFRHTLASWLAMRDVQLKKIALVLGDTVATVDRYYSHLLPSSLDETLNEALKW